MDMEVTLPGGLLINGRIERKVRFRPVTGKTELALDELELTNVPSSVSALLRLTVERIGDEPVNEACINELCIADRQFLMLKLATLLGGDNVWLKVICSHCDSPFDVEINRGELPVKAPGESFPYVTLSSRFGKIVLRLPTAVDQLEIIHLNDKEAERALLQRCIISVDGRTDSIDDWIDQLSEEMKQNIDQALDELSPAVCRELLVCCPECKSEQRVELDHYSLADLNTKRFLNEVHTLAMHYHCSEEEILSMPRKRRHKYLHLIDCSRAMTGSAG